MKGIFSLSTHLTGSFSDSYALAGLILNIILFGANIYATYRLWAPPNNKNKFRKIRYGSGVLLLWYILLILDLFFHEGQLKTTYGYILYYFFLVSTRLATNLLILAGTCEIVSDQLYTQYGQTRFFRIGELVLLVLTVMALYYAGSLLATIILWVRVAEPSLISSCARQQDHFKATFYVIQWLLTLAMLVATSWLLFVSEKQKYRQLQTQGRQQQQQQQQQTPDLVTKFTFGAATLLWIRSFAELVIAVHFDVQHHALHRGTTLASDIIYGLTTLLLLLHLDFIIRNTDTSNSRSALQAQIEADFRRHVLETVEGAVAKGQPAPALMPVFKQMRRNPAGVVTDATKEAFGELPAGQKKTTRRLQGEYLAGLEERFGSIKVWDRTREV